MNADFCWVCRIAINGVRFDSLPGSMSQAEAAAALVEERFGPGLVQIINLTH